MSMMFHLCSESGKKPSQSMLMLEMLKVSRLITIAVNINDGLMRK